MIVAKLYTNENFPLPTVETLRKLGHDVRTTADSGKSNQRIPDDEVLAFSVKEQRILVTFNRRHFIKLHQEQPNHAGIIICTVDSNFDTLAERIHAVLEANPTMTGKLVRVQRPNK